MAGWADYFASAAIRHRDLPAVSWDGTSLSYADLAERASEVAHGLAKRGLRPGDRVVLWMENHGLIFPLLLGAWWAGLAVAPVNARLHAREAAYIAASSRARIIFASPEQAAALRALPDPPAGEVIAIDEPSLDGLLGGGRMDPVAVGADSPAWLFYTSGTTGRPKGAVLSHANLLGQALRYFADIDQVQPGSVKLHAAPLSHASGLYALPFLLRGGHQVVLPGFDVARIAAALDRWDGVTMFAAPTMLKRLVDGAAAASLRCDRFRTLYYGGGPMHVSDLLEARALFPGRLYQTYGQGETPMTITGLDRADHASNDPAILGSCGTARTGVEVCILDQDGQRAAPGVIGEVATRSDCVMQGYLDDPAATAQAIRAGWLHTGDVGRIDERGYLTLLDRSKDVIISGGSNIYPREVEEVLLEEPAVREVSVVGVPDAEWGECVAAFLVLKPGQQVTAEALDQRCLARIARFKRPKAYHFVDELPKNAYGKILKTALRGMLA